MKKTTEKTDALIKREKINDLYIKAGRPGLSKFWNYVKKMKEKDFIVDLVYVKDFYKNQEVNQLTKKAVQRQDKYRKIVGPPLSFQMDKMFINKKLKGASETVAEKTEVSKAKTTTGEIKRENFYYVFLLFIDIISRKAYIYRIPNSTGKTDADKDRNYKANTIATYEQFLDDLLKDIDALQDTYDEYPRKTPVSITTDDGFGAYFTKYNEDKLNVPVDNETANDDHITAGNRLGIIDRLVRTVKANLTKRIYAGDKVVPINDTMKDIVAVYNDTEHLGINSFTPNDVFDSKDLRYMIYMNKLKHNAGITDDSGISIGDTVRIYERRKLFAKEAPRFSKKIYTVKGFIGSKYKVMDDKGNTVTRLLKEKELQKVDVTKLINANPRDIAEEVKTEEVKQNVIKERRKIDAPDIAVNLAEPRALRSRVKESVPSKFR